jgi:hypothetical protein
MLDSRKDGNMGHVKTTVDIEDGLYRIARTRAIDEDRPFRAVLNDALRGYLGTGEPAASPALRRRPRRAPTRVPAGHRHRRVTAAEFWAIVNDRSRWDELFEDRSRKIEAQIADATERWNRRAQR